jgi:hypothetical protein
MSCIKPAVPAFVLSDIWTTTIGTGYWNGARVSLAYSEKPIRQDATVLFQSFSLKNEKSAAEKAKVRKGASGL